jgi:hypothetical protein
MPRQQRLRAVAHIICVSPRAQIRGQASVFDQAKDAVRNNWHHISHRALEAFIVLEDPLIAGLLLIKALSMDLRIVIIKLNTHCVICHQFDS